jgi:predicted ArsR family transcriptional regulator
LHSTKSLILAFIKRNWRSTVDELAQALGLAPMTVRQHLTAPQCDDLLEAEPVRRATGRPHYIYRLTRRGDNALERWWGRGFASRPWKVAALVVDM